MSVLLYKIPSPLNLDIRKKEEHEFVAGQSLATYINNVPTDDPDIEFIISLNGNKVAEPYHLVEVSDGDLIAATPKTGVSAAAAFAGWATAAILGTGYAVTAAYIALYAVSFLAATFVIGYGMSMLASALAPDAPEHGDTSIDQVYTWGTLSQTHNEGVSIPTFYGRNKVSGHIINQFSKVTGADAAAVDTLYILLGLCGHELSSISDIELNGQPFNYFKNCSVQSRLGTLDDEAIEGFGELVTQNDVGSSLSTGSPVVKQTQGDCEKIEIVLTAPAGFYYSNDEGGLSERSATYTIKYRVVGNDAWATFISEKKWAGATTEVLKQVETIDDLQLHQYEISVTRTDTPETTYRARSEIVFTAMQEIVKEELTYPGLAKYSAILPATDQLSGGMPALNCIANRDTVQVFDPGSELWVPKSSNNPAWICYDMLTQHIPPERILYYEFAEWAAFCDEDVSGPTEEYEARIVCNTIISGGNVWDQLQKVAKIGRSAIIQRSTKYGVFLDKQDDQTSHIFTMGNIVEGTFSIQYLPKEDRAVAIELEYNDPDRDFSRQIVTVYSDEYINGDSTAKKASVSFAAALPQKQVVREGIFRINSNKYLCRVITFDAFLDAAACVTGDIFDFQHESINFLKSEASGILDGAGVNDGNGRPYVTLDQEVVLEAAGVYKIRVRMSDDSFVDKTVDNSKIADFSVPHQILPLTQSWASVPDNECVYAFGPAATYLKKYRICGVTRKDENTRTIVALEYINAVYSENDAFVIDEPHWEAARQEAIQVSANEVLIYAKDGHMTSSLNVTWMKSYSSVSTSWDVWLEDLTAGSAVTKVATTVISQATVNANFILGHEYKVYVCLASEGFIDTGKNSTTIIIKGKAAKPSDVLSFTGTWNPIRRAVHFTWTPVNDIDLDYYQIREGSSWETGEIVSTARKADVTSTIFIEEGVSATRTYRIKAVDTSRESSENEKVAVVPINTSDCALALPGDLVLTSSSHITANGTDAITLFATWNADAEVSSTWHHYDIILENTAIGKRSMFATADREYQWAVMPVTEYGVTLRAVDVSGNHTEWIEMVVETTIRDEVPPAIPTWPSEDCSIPGFKVIGLKWDKNTDYDLANYQLERSTTSEFTEIVELGQVDGSFTADSLGLEPDTRYYYRLRAEDSSGNVSGYSDVRSEKTLLIGTTDIAYDAIIANHINVTNLAAIKADLGTIVAGRLQNEQNTTYFDLTNDLLKLGNRLSWDGIDLSIAGSITLTAPSTGFQNFSDRPTSLAEINQGEFDAISPPLFTWEGTEPLNLSTDIDGADEWLFDGGKTGGALIQIEVPDDFGGSIEVALNDENLTTEVWDCGSILDEVEYVIDMSQPGEPIDLGGIYD